MTTSSADLLSMIQTSAENGTLLPSCAPEIKALMTQISTLISQRQREWEGCKRGLTTQLQQRDRDIVASRLQIRERNTQVEHLCQESSALEHEYKTRYTHYEAELDSLRGEVARLTKAYAHLRARRRPREVPRPVDNPGTGEDLLAGRLLELTTENNELKESLGLLQETLDSKEELVRTLQEEVAFSQSTASAASCQSGQERLRTQLALDKALRNELGRLKESNGTVSLFLDRVKSLEQEVGSNEGEGVEQAITENLESALEQILDKHFEHLDSSLHHL